MYISTGLLDRQGAEGARDAVLKLRSPVLQGDHEDGATAGVHMFRQ